MTRLSGIQLLASGIVLWALAVWMFGAPHPEATETAATAPADTVEKPGADEASQSGAPPMPASSAQVVQGPAAPSEPDAGVGTPSSQADSARVGDAASMPSAPRVPPAATPEVPAAADGSRIALAPADPQAGGPVVPRVPRAGGAPGSPGSPGSPDSPPPDPWFEHGYAPPPPPPARPAMNGGAVASQINSARRAAWEGRLTDALAHYRAAARIAPNNHVVWGEMGNVLWTMRRWSEAAYALEGAATLLIRAGELRAASELVPAVERIDPDAAYRVQRLLWAAAQRQSG